MKQCGILPDNATSLDVIDEEPEPDSDSGEESNAIAESQVLSVQSNLEPSSSLQFVSNTLSADSESRRRRLSLSSSTSSEDDELTKTKISQPPSQLPAAPEEDDFSSLLPFLLSLQPDI